MCVKSMRLVLNDMTRGEGGRGRDERREGGGGGGDLLTQVVTCNSTMQEGYKNRDGGSRVIQSVEEEVLQYKKLDLISSSKLQELGLAKKAVSHVTPLLCTASSFSSSLSAVLPLSNVILTTESAMAVLDGSSVFVELLRGRDGLPGVPSRTGVQNPPHPEPPPMALEFLAETTTRHPQLT